MIFLYQNIKILLLCMCMVVGIAESSSARTRVSIPAIAPLSFECIADAANTHGVPIAVMLGILASEGGRPGEALSNRNGTWDLGPYQINTCNLNLLLKQGYQPEAILADACVNAHAAAFLIRQAIVQSNNIWEALGYYHSRTPHRKYQYAVRVIENMAKLKNFGSVSALIDYTNGKRKGW